MSQKVYIEYVVGGIGRHLCFTLAGPVDIFGTFPWDEGLKLQGLYCKVSLRCSSYLCSSIFQDKEFGCEALRK